MVSLLIFLVSTSLATFWYFVIRDPKGARARAEARRFRERLLNFKSHTHTLVRHSDEYSAEFSTHEWGRLNDTLARLDQIEQEVQTLITLRSYSEALAILERVNNQSSPTPSIEQCSREIKDLEELIDWQRNVHAMLKKVVSNLEIAATETKKISTTKPLTTPRPTLTTLADIKKILLEDEELRKLSS